MTAFRRTRWRLAAWNLAVLALVLAAVLAGIAVAEVRARDQALERELRLGAQREVARFGSDDDSRAEAFSADTSDLFAFSIDRRGRVVRNSRQVSLPGLPDGPSLTTALQGTEVTANVTAGGVPVKLLSVPVYHEGRIDGAVQVGRSVADVQAELTQFLLILLATGGVGLVLAGIGSIFLAGQAMRPIERAFEQQRQFLADASHELRTPTAVVRARSQALEHLADTLPPEARDDVRLLRQDADELSDLLNELLDLARLDAGQETLSLEPVPLGDVVEELTAQLQPLAREHGVDLTASVAPVWASTNLTRVRQVLRALADNALKHTPPGGRVRIEVARDAARARVQVVDTGEGIAPEHLPHVFDRFYRADAARARANGRESGTGLGLAIAAQLVRRMRGDLRVASEPGSGTTATVLLPLATPAPVPG